jgi:DNA-binding transcriptional LysR family regulator
MMSAIEDWRVFVAVGTRRSFVGAARALRRSPQAVTRGVAALERRLGARLLHRTTRSVTLTSDGERLVEQGRLLLAEFDRLESRRAADAPIAGTLSVTAPVLFGQLHVVPLVARFLKEHPAMSVRLLLLDRPVSLADEGLDLAVRIGELADSSLQALRAREVRSVVCASPAYLKKAGVPASPEDLSGHDCIAFTATTPSVDRWTFPRRGARARLVAVRPRLVVNTGQAAIDAALAGLGIVRVLSYQVERPVARGELRLLLEAFEPSPLPVHLLRLPGAPSRAQQAFVDLALPALRARQIEKAR